MPWWRNTFGFSARSFDAASGIDWLDMIIEFRCEREHARRWMDRETLSIDGRDIPVQIAWTATTQPRPAGLDALFELERVVLAQGQTQRRRQAEDRPGAHAGRRRRRRRDRRFHRRGSGSQHVLLGCISAHCSTGARRRKRRARRHSRRRPARDRDRQRGRRCSPRSRPPFRRNRGRLERRARNRHGANPHHGGGNPVGTAAYRAAAGASSRRRHRPGGPAAYVARGLAVSIAKEIYRLCCYAPHWHIGWRFNDGPGVWQTGDLSGPGWNVLGDPGHRFYADPFPIAWQGRTFVFFEDLDHRIGKASFPRSSSTMQARWATSCPCWRSPGTSPIRF